MVDFLLNPQVRIMFQLLLAAILEGLVGFEREYQKRAAGLRTHSLVCIGATLFTVISLEAFGSWLDKPGVSFDPSRILAAIVMGVGFIGAGLIVYRRFRIEGLTTAAGMWVVAAIGMAIGVQFYFIAIFTAFLTLAILTVLRLLEEKIFGKEE